MKKIEQPLSVTHPLLAKEAFGWNPEDFTFGMLVKVSWQCHLGHKYEMAIVSRTSRGYNCPFCSGKKVLKGFNDLKTTHPDIAKESLGWHPDEVSAGSGRKLLWRCTLGHSFISTPFHRTRGDGCPICSNKKVLKGFNDLLTTHPNLAKEAFEFDPTEVVSGTQKSLKWICKSRHIYSASPAQRTKKLTGCPYCAGQKLLRGFNDLKTKSPTLAREADGWDASKIFFRSNKRLSWKCPEGHKYFAVLSNRQFHNSGCPYCSGKRILTGFNDLQTLYPELAKEADGWDSSTISPNSHKKFSWKCKCGHTWSTSPNRRIISIKKMATQVKTGGCPRCAGKIVVFGENDLSSLFPEVARQAHGWDPTKVTAKSKKRREWVCEQGHYWKAIIGNRTAGLSGCPTCANSGFDPNDKGYLYFLEHPTWHMFQIGITNRPEDRLKSHSKLGWETLEVRGPMDGHLTQQWETAILRMLKAKGADLANSKIAGKFDGYSEAWSKGKFEAKSIRQLIDLTEEFENRENTKRSR